jgi:hypothetical protein
MGFVNDIAELMTESDEAGRLSSWRARNRRTLSSGRVQQTDAFATMSGTGENFDTGCGERLLDLPKRARASVDVAAFIAASAFSLMSALSANDLYDLGVIDVFY